MLRKRLLFLPAVLIPIIGIIIGSSLDLQINQAIYDRYNGFGIFFSAFGEFPVYSFLGVMAAGFISLCKSFKKVWQRILLIVLAIGCFGVSIYFQGKHIFALNAYDRDDLLLVGFAIAAVMVGLAYVAGYFLFKYATLNPKQILIILLTVAVIYGVSIGINQLLKLGMARPRSRFLFDTDTVGSNYRNWWESGKSVRENWVGELFPNGREITKEEFKSFPSGHLANTALFLPMFMTVPMINNHVKIKDWVIVGISTAWCMLLAYTRMRVGAHYLSDVSFGALGTVIVCIALNQLGAYFYRKYGTDEVKEEPSEPAQENE